MNWKLLFTFLLVQVSVVVSSQQKWEKAPFRIDPPVCYGSGKVEKSFTPPPPELLLRLKSGVPTANIEVKYINFPENAKAAFEYAVHIWENLLNTPVTIYIEASWQKLSDNVLGSCGPTGYYTSFEGAPIPYSYYPVALVEKILEEELTGPESPDITARFSSSIDWYFGTDGNTPVTQYDFVSTVLHEIAHGLGFVGFFQANESTQTAGYGYGDPYGTAFDYFIENEAAQRLTNSKRFPNPSIQLYVALTTGQLYSGSPVAYQWGGKTRPRLYAPATYSSGSSVYHLDESTYPYGNENSLMTHAAGKGEAIHRPGPLSSGILADIGWKHLYIRFNELKDVENSAQPLLFEASISGDLGVDTTSLFLFYSTDTFKTHVDSIALTPQTQPTFFAASLLPPVSQGSLFYFISARDTLGRRYTKPDLAPAFVYELYIGPDTIKPVIQHDPIAFILSSEKEVELRATVTDNLGIDTVWVNYSVNGVPKPPFGLSPQKDDLFSGFFRFSNEELTDNARIEYTIWARDASSAKHVTVLPGQGTFSFTVEPIYQPVFAYFNDFNGVTSDFILKDFNISQPQNFDNGALHSPHPYPSPEKDNTFLEFITILRYPILVKQDGRVSFDEVVLVEPGEAGSVFGDDDFWDYVIVEGSKDAGRSWLPLVNGYDSQSQAAWLTAYNQRISEQNSLTPGTKELFFTREFSLTGNGNFNAGDTVLIRFRLHSDPYAHGWGWAIDNLRIQQPATAVSQPLLAAAPLLLWPNPFANDLHLRSVSPESFREVHIEISDLTGRLVFRESFRQVFPGATLKIDAAHIPIGFCIITVKADGIPLLRQKMIKSGGNSLP